MQYNDIVEQLLKLDNPKEESSVYISAYIPNQSDHREEFSKYIKSSILDALRKSDKTRNLDRYYGFIIQSILNSFKELKDFKDGVGIFAKINLIDLEKNNAFFLHLFPLTRKTNQEIVISESFDIDQLIWLEDFKVFSVQLEEQSAKIYYLENGKIDLIREIENEYIKAEQKEGMGRAAGYGQPFGIAPKENFQDEQNKHFLFQISNWVKNNMSEFDVKYLVFFMSPKFQEHRDFVESFFNEIKKIGKIYVNKLLTSEKEILKNTWNEVIDFSRKNKKQLLQEAKDNFNEYVEGWEGVVNAANENRIMTLFTESTASQEGYLDENGNLHVGKAVTSKSTNIAPLVVKKVINASGDVIVFKDQKVGENVHIAARLRY